MIYYLFGQGNRRVRMNHKIGKIEDLWGLSLLFSYMREMSNVNNRMAWVFKTKNMSIVLSACLDIGSSISYRELAPPQLEKSKFPRTIS